MPVEHKKQIIRELFYTLLLSLIKSSKLFSLQNSQMCWRWWTRWFMITFTNYYLKLTWLESQFMHPSSSCTDGEMNGHVWFFPRNFTFSTHQLTFQVYFVRYIEPHDMLRKQYCRKLLSEKVWSHFMIMRIGIQDNCKRKKICRSAFQFFVRQQNKIESTSTNYIFANEEIESCIMTSKICSRLLLRCL